MNVTNHTFRFLEIKNTLDWGGIWLKNDAPNWTTHVKINHVMIYNVQRHCIRLQRTKYAWVQNNYLSNRSHKGYSGICVGTDSMLLWIEHNLIEQNGEFGIYLTGSTITPGDFIEISDNILLNNGGWLGGEPDPGKGISVTSTDFVRIKDNTVAYTNGIGIVVWECLDVDIDNNNVVHSLEYGIYVQGTKSKKSFVRISDNRVCFNHDGIYIGWSIFHIQARDNTIHNNTGNGIFVCGSSDYTYLKDNYVYYNGGYGIIVEKATINYLFMAGNDLLFNGLGNLHDNSASDRYEYGNRVET